MLDKLAEWGCAWTLQPCYRSGDPIGGEESLGHSPGGAGGLVGAAWSGLWRRAGPPPYVISNYVLYFAFGLLSVVLQSSWDEVYSSSTCANRVSRICRVPIP